MNDYGKWIVLFFLSVGLSLGCVQVGYADHPSDGVHDQALVPADCTGCHAAYGIVTEHIENLGYGYTCSTCHSNSNQDIIDTIYRGRYDDKLVFCTFCHATTARDIHVHDDGAGHIEHDHVIADPSCSSLSCHAGSDIKAIHIDESEHDLDKKLSCYTCHGETHYISGALVFQQNPVVRAAVAQGIAGSDVTCTDCHGAASHASAHDHALIDNASCEACHSANVVDEHITNQGLACAVCHESADAVVVNAIATGSAGTDVYCLTCHGPTDHSGSHNHAVITAPFCADCHNADINVEHIDNHGLACTSCHSSSDPLVVNAIATGSGPAGVDVSCDACHGSTDHSGAHDHAVITPGNCVDCHSSNINTEHIDNHGLTCATCHGSADAAVVAAIALGRSGTDVTCNNCHGVIDHAAAHNHAVITAGDCNICHNPDVIVEHIDNQSLNCLSCHDSSDPLVINAIATGSGPAGTDVDCEACHGGSTDHSLAHDQTVITPGNCVDCHNADINIEHTNHGHDCYICHTSGDPLVVAAIASGINGNPVDCDACHGSTDHSGAHDHAVITPGNCVDCHSADINVEHITNQGLACNVCHISSDPQVIAAINLGIAGTDVNCNACHGVTDHSAAHDHAVITPGNCVDCHSADINTEHLVNQGLACNVCHVSSDPLVVSAIAAGIAGTDVTCNACHGTTDHSAAHDHTVISAPFCADCHSADINVEHITNQGLNCNVCHISNDPLVEAAIAAGSGPAGTDVSCDSCHGPTDHSEAHDHAVITAGNCADCHSSNINTEHIDKQGLDCATCHSSSNAAVVAAIADGISGTDVTCDACHGITDHSSAHDHAVVTAAFCTTCHSADINVEHINNHALVCTTCHSSADPLVSAAITLGMGGVDVNCDTCHGSVDHAGAHNHAVITPGNCVDCHSANINTEHIDKHGLDCATCHSSSDAAVIAAINLGVAGTDVDCEACHGVVNHANVHDHAVITPGICIDCHAANVVVEHVDNHSLTCTVCHNNSAPQVVAAISQGSGPAGTDVDCNACHGVVEHAAVHDHAVLPDSDCRRCHSAAIVVEHAAHGFNDCNVCHGSTDPVIVAAIVAGRAGSDVSCAVCHPDAAAAHAVAHDAIYLRMRVGNAATVISSEDDPADGFYDNLAAYLPSLTCGECHKGIAENHWGNFHSGLRVSDLFDSSGNPLLRGQIDPSRPWISGPGMAGNWCPTYNRQLPDLTASFADTTEFTAKVDLGIFEFVKECGSCHVGGGPGAENPFGFVGFSSIALDDTVRAAALDNGTVALNAWDFYVDDNGSVTRGNWYADSGILDVDCLMCHLKDYNHLARNASIRAAGKFAAAAPIGAGIAVPDPITPAELDYATHQVSRDGIGQLYLNRNFSARIVGMPADKNCLGCHMPEMVLHENELIAGDLWQSRYYAAVAVPSLDPENPDPLLAANLKPAIKRNELLKRGVSWRSDEVHKFMGCSGCHSRTGKTQAVNPDLAPDDYLHSPGKGYDPMKYPSVADGSVKLCEDCHVRYGDLDGDGSREMQPFAPPEMQIYHAQAGLLAKVVPTARRIADASGTEETFLGNHIDIIACTACHIRKRYTAARSVDHATGATYYNLVGAAPDQLPGAEVVDLAYSWKENVSAKVINGQPNPDWRRQIFPFNYLTSSYWDNTGSADVNGDGFTTGAVNGVTVVSGDPFFERTIKSFFAYDYVNSSNDRVASGLPGVPALDQRGEWAAVGADGNIIFTTAAEIDAFQALLHVADSGYMPRLNLESRPNLVAHNILPIRSGVGLSGGEAFAFGAPTRDALGKVTGFGCGDCHGGADGLFNGAVTMLGQVQRVSDGTEIPLTVSWNGAGDVKASALAWNRTGIPFTIDFSAANQTRDLERREFLGYDAARQAMLNSVDPASYGIGVDPVADILSIGDAFAVGLPADEYDWSLATAQPLEVGLGATVDMVAVSTGTAGIFEYRWNVNDEPGTLVGSLVEKVFSHVGVWTVMLTVIDEEGHISQNIQKVNVLPSASGMQVAVVNVVGGSSSVTLQLSNLPAHDQIKFYFGDGTRQYVSDAGVSFNLDRDYRLKDTFRMLYDPDTGVRYDSENDPTSNNEYEAWVYKTSIRLYLDGEWVDNETVNVTVVIPVL